MSRWIGPRPEYDYVDNILAAADEWKQRCLLADGSVFTDESLWTPANVGELEQLVDSIKKPPAREEWGLDGWTQLNEKLRVCPELVPLAAEAFWFTTLYPDNRAKPPSWKRDRINELWEIAGPRNPIDLIRPGITNDKALHGVADTSFQHWMIWISLSYVLRMNRVWKEEHSPIDLQQPPWQFIRWLREKKVDWVKDQKCPMRLAILYLLFPDYVERVQYSEQKSRIIAAFGNPSQKATSTDIVTEDEVVYEIRQRLEDENGTKHLDFFRPPLDKWKRRKRGGSVSVSVTESGPRRNQNEDSAVLNEMKELAEELLFDEPFLRRVEKLLDDKRQVIFQGPPGTGKTYVARKLAECLAGGEERVRLIQFHPSYAYEDFVQGFRPLLKDGQAGFKLTSGPLLDAAEAAHAEPDQKHFLVIDEINRGNLSKVFGELYYLLEYRDQSMRLQYSPTWFALPANLFVIGTMNTADRSIAMVDLALRRRFHFVEFHPDKPPVAGLLARWIERNAPKYGWLAGVVDRANELLGDRQAAVGPSYFMKEGLDDEMVDLIWEHNVLPYVEEHLYGEADRLAEFDLDALRKAAAADGDGAQEDEGAGK